jgi:site-specific DNA-cytosine methylase
MPVEACPHLAPRGGTSLSVGTDCSGADAPIFALRAMNIIHRHVFSCDNAAGPQQFIKQNTPPDGVLFTDMMQRDPSDVPAHHIYVAGFPCKAFSLLNSKSKLLKEPTARPFLGVLRTLRACHPAVAVLENVIGLKRVLAHVMRRLTAVGPYHVVVLEMDPRHLGEPVRRPRLYIVMIRRDVAAVSDTQSLDRLAQHIWQSLACTRTAPVTSRMLPNDHPVVMASRHTSQQRGGVAPSRLATRPPRRWHAHHQDFCKSHGVPRGEGPEADVLGLSAPREREAWTILCRSFPSALLVADLSQCLTRTVCKTDGTVPTITPGAHLAVRALRRCVLPVEKLLLHAFPLHKLSLGNLSGTALSSLGGNTMHVQCVGAALAIALSLTRGDITRPSLSIARPLPQTGRHHHLKRKATANHVRRSTTKRLRTAAPVPNTYTRGLSGLFG